MTLRELLADRPFPFKALNKELSYTPIEFVTIRGDYLIGIYVSEPGSALQMFSTNLKTENRILDNWELYTEPRPKKKMYAYIKNSGGSVHRVVYSESERLSEVFESNSKYYRAPTLDVEVEE